MVTNKHGKKMRLGWSESSLQILDMVYYLVQWINTPYLNYRSLGKIHRWIFSCEICSWCNIFVPWSLQWIKTLPFYSVKSILCIQFLSCHTSDENFLTSNFSQTTLWACYYYTEVTTLIIILQLECTAIQSVRRECLR